MPLIAGEVLWRWRKEYPAQLHDAHRDAYRAKMADFRQRKREGRVRKYERSGKYAKKGGHTPKKAVRRSGRNK